jgi:hypothetical protein
MITALLGNDLLNTDKEGEEIHRFPMGKQARP